MLVVEHCKLSLSEVLLGEKCGEFGRASIENMVKLTGNEWGFSRHFIYNITSTVSTRRVETLVIPKFSIICLWGMIALERVLYFKLKLMLYIKVKERELYGSCLMLRFIILGVRRYLDHIQKEMKI